MSLLIWYSYGFTQLAIGFFIGHYIGFNRAVKMAIRHKSEIERRRNINQGRKKNG